MPPPALPTKRKNPSRKASKTSSSPARTLTPNLRSSHPAHPSTYTSPNCTNFKANSGCRQIFGISMSGLVSSPSSSRVSQKACHYARCSLPTFSLSRPRLRFCYRRATSGTLRTGDSKPIISFLFRPYEGGH